MDLLIVEDERSLADDIKAYLDGPGVRCAIAGTVREALDTILNKPFDCLVLDLTLPDGNGLEVLRELKGMGRTDGVVIISHGRSNALAMENAIGVAKRSVEGDVPGTIGRLMATLETPQVAGVG